MEPGLDDSQTDAQVLTSPLRSVRFSDCIQVLPTDEGEADHYDVEVRWFSVCIMCLYDPLISRHCKIHSAMLDYSFTFYYLSDQSTTNPIIVTTMTQQAEIALFREDSKLTMRTLQACGGQESQLDNHIYCLRGLEKMRLKRPPHNFVKNVLALQAEHKKAGICDPISLRLFSIACGKWARKRALQLGAEDEYDAYQIFMEGLRKPPETYSDEEDEDNDLDYYGEEEEELGFCIPGEDFLDDDYDYDDNVNQDRSEYGGLDAIDFGNNYPKQKAKPHHPSQPVFDRTVGKASMADESVTEHTMEETDCDEEDDQDVNDARNVDRKELEARYSVVQDAAAL